MTNFIYLCGYLNEEFLKKISSRTRFALRRVDPSLALFSPADGVGAGEVPSMLLKKH